MYLRILLLWALMQTGLALASNPSRTVLVTGGAGYIGSHTCLELLHTGRYQVVVVDNLDNSCEEALERVKQLSGSSHQDKLHFRHCDIRSRDTLAGVLQEFPDISSCIHFAGLKVGPARKERRKPYRFDSVPAVFLCVSTGCRGICFQTSYVL